MEHDLTTNEFIFTPQQGKAIGRLATTAGVEELRVPASEAVELLEACETRRQQIANAEVAMADMPAGAQRTAYRAELVRTSELVAGIITELKPHLPSVADSAEEFLRNN